MSLGEVNDEYLVHGKVIHVKGEKQKFHYNRYLYVYTLVIAADTGKMTALKIFPFRGDEIPSLPIRLEDTVSIFGEWREHQFIISRIEKQK
ncbi:hypothetical protein JOC77_001824 [Peribacillus deserti]|uniref:Uncharacterized protein n=2 Tax=Peribacillus deserti TaxID=673318 RepID=A0ABS2QGW7_9BACI|nr:hypothetical protein [Peribacillus deserti]